MNTPNKHVVKHVAGALGRLLELLIERHSSAVIAGFALVAIVLAWLALATTIGPGLDELLIQGDPDLERNHEIQRDFSNDELIVIAFDLGRELDAEALRMLERIHRRIASLEGVDEVLDLATIEDVRALADDPSFLEASSLVDFSTLEDAGEIERLRERARGHRLYQGSLVSEDLRVVSTIVIPRLVPADKAKTDKAKKGYEGKGALGSRDSEAQARLNARLTEAIYAIVREAPVPAWVSGYPPAELEAQRIVLGDLTRLTALALVLILALVYVLIRKWWALVLLLVVAGWTELAALSWLAANDQTITVVTSTLPVVLLATSSTYAIYLLNLLARVSKRARGVSSHLGTELFREVAPPCLLSAASTAGGFLALLLMPVPSIQDLGAALAVGIAACLTASLLLVPAIVQRFHLRIDHLPYENSFGWTSAGVTLARRPIWVLGATAAVAVASVAGIARLEVESDPLTYWRPDHFHRKSDDFIRQSLGGSLFLNATLSTGRERGALDPEVLGFAAKWIERAEQSPIVSRTVSLLDYFAMIDQVLDEGRGNYLRSRQAAAEYLLLYENAGDPDDLRHYIDFDRGALNILLRVNSRSSLDILALRADLLRAAQDPPAGVRAEVLGTWLLFPKAMDAITHGMVRGLSLALVVVFLIMAVGLRSLRLAAVAMIPNTLPILVCLGALGWLGIPLSFGTSIVGCIALGLAVDDTAHVLGHLGGASGAERSLEQVFRRVGRALATTTLSLGIGFLALLLSGFLPLVHFGVATAASLSVALLCDLFVLPSLLKVTGWRAASERRIGSPTTIAELS